MDEMTDESVMVNGYLGQFLVPGLYIHVQVSLDCNAHV